MAKTVVGLFDDANATRVAKELEQAGFASSDMELRSNRIQGSTTALTNIGVPKRDADVYSDAIKNGASLITLKTSDARADEASAIMNNAAAWDSGARTGMKAGAKRADLESGAVIPVVEEELEVGKRTMETGGVRVFTHMTETPVSEQVTLREEHVSVERRPVDRPATEADLSAVAQDKTIELTERAEKAVVGKTAHVVEEVRVGKEVEQRTETVTDTVRKTEVEVENLGAGARSSGWELESKDLRKHFDSNYASKPDARWESYEPAYRLGHEMSSDRRYAARDWNAIEGDARTSWDKKQPGTWERMKGAVRHAFDRSRAKAGATARR